MNSRQESGVLVASAVAALIGAALVFKGFEVQRSKARQSTCQANLKQIGLGTLQYVRDYDEKYPLAHNWSTVLLPYTKSTVLFQCPERGALIQGYAFHRSAGGTNMAAFANPAKMVLYFDSMASVKNSSDTGVSVAHFRHPRGTNIAYADGHVKAEQEPDFTFGYGEAFLHRQRENEAASVRFYKELRARRLREIAAQKKKKK
jgi:prepilin-type processing-associated H-X9-DG protein